MKIGGIIALVFGALNLFIGISLLSTEYADKAGEKIGFGIGALALGLYLINRAKQKKEEEEAKKKWTEQNSE